MPLPVVYTEGTLLAFMETEVGPVGVALGLLTSDALQEAVNGVIGLLGHDLSTETTTAGVVKVRAIATWLAWLAALNAATSQFDVSLTGGKKFLLSQQYEMISKRLAMAEAAASVYEEVQAASGAGGVAVVTSLSSSDPYSPYDEFA